MVRLRTLLISKILKNLKEMQFSQDLASLVFAFIVASFLVQVLCYVIEKIKNFAVHVMNQEAGPREDQTEMQRTDAPARGEDNIEENKKQPVEHEWID